MPKIVQDRPPFFARHIISLVILLVVGFVWWAAWANVDEIARGQGKVIPFSKTQIVQSSESGIVEEIAVTLGQIVSEGDLLIRLDSSQNLTALGETQARIDAAMARIARLQLEIEDLFGSEFVCPEETKRVSEEICLNEAQLVEARRANYRNKSEVLIARRIQRENEIAEADANINQLTAVLEEMSAERAQIAPLVQRRLHPEINLTRLDREIAQHSGELEVAKQSVIRLQAALDEAELQVQELDLQLRQEARTELSEALAELNVLRATVEGASERVRRTDILSPVDGIVNTLDVNTLGAFIEPGSVVAGIVPITDKLLVEARISPRDVAFVQPRQKALVKLTAYDFSIYGGLDGQVSNVSADSLVDQDSGETYYQVLVQTGDAQVGKGQERHNIRPGMVASVEILTGEKTVLDYLLKPLSKARQEALTER